MLRQTHEFFSVRHEEELKRSAVCRSRFRLGLDGG
jgi:hypothetical protein